jgi:glucose-6-phosphate isomerase
MKKSLLLNLDYITSVVSSAYQKSLYAQSKTALQSLLQHQGLGNDFLGWVTLPTEMKKQVQSIKRAARALAQKCDAIICIGIGGSYLGIRSTLEALHDEVKTQIYYAGHHLSAHYLNRLMQELKDRQVGLCVISKSGTTTEPALVFRILKSWLEKKHGKNQAKQRIVAITDRSQGALKSLADAEGYPTLVIPDDVGGRYSVLTPVGLFPIAAAGISIDALLQGAEDAALDVSRLNIENNLAAQYAIARFALYQKGKVIEVLANFRPDLHFISEWWKQLFGESEGKDQQGIFPASVDLTTDLHSMGQFLQEGSRNIFETMVWVQKESHDLLVPGDPSNRDGLNFLKGKKVSWINEQAMRATAFAHQQGGVPVIQLQLAEMTPYCLGYLYQFFEMACGISGRLFQINPFDQPGVEAYKKNMFALLGKPGFEQLAAQLKKKGI